MFVGVLCALGAGLLWGLVFIVPVLLPQYPGVLLSFGRYLAYGLIALVPAWIGRRQLAQLTSGDWRAALRLSIVGNLVYYAALASAIQLAGAPLPAVLIGTLPVVISVAANWAPGHGAHRIAWFKLLPSLALLLLGVILVNIGEWRQPDLARTPTEFALGLVIAVIALAAWTWYPIHNARHLARHPAISASTWATAQGVAILPLTIVGFAAATMWQGFTDAHFAAPFGPEPWRFIGLMAACGLGASWLGTLLWNQACRRLPTSLAGQLIVFETLAALGYAFALRGAWPTPPVTLGVMLLCVGIFLGMRAFHASRR